MAPTGDMWLDDRPFTSCAFSRGHSSHLSLQRSRSLLISRDSRNPTITVIPWDHASHRSGVSNTHMRWRFVARPAYPSMEYYGDSEAGRWDLGSLSGVSLSSCFSPCRPFLFFIRFGFWIRGHGPSFSSTFSLASSLPSHQPFLTVVVFCFPVLPPLYILSALPLCIYLPLLHTHTVVYQLRYKLAISIHV